MRSTIIPSRNGTPTSKEKEGGMGPASNGREKEGGVTMGFSLPRVDFLITSLQRDAPSGLCAHAVVVIDGSPWP